MTVQSAHGNHYGNDRYYRIQHRSTSGGIWVHVGETRNGLYDAKCALDVESRGVNDTNWRIVEVAEIWSSV